MYISGSITVVDMFVEREKRSCNHVLYVYIYNKLKLKKIKTNKQTNKQQQQIFLTAFI